MKIITQPNRDARGFSLIELLVVVALIVILAGLTIAGFAFVQQKVARSKATEQLHLLQTGIQSYYSDNRKYPPNDGDTTGERGSEALFKALYQDGYDAKNNGGGGNTATSTSATIYIGEVLDPTTNKEGKGGQAWIRTSGNAANSQIIDPWGSPWLYRTGKDAINPDFDLWSKGKDLKTSTTNPKDKDARDDISNFH